MKSFIYNFKLAFTLKSLLKVKNWCKSILSFLLVLSISVSLFAQKDASGRIPVYEVPYEYPTVDGIKEVLNRVRTYYESTSPQLIVDNQTGVEITDFSKFNKNAVPSQGFSSEWSYTHGVVLSAFEYIDDVIGDEVFIENKPK